MFMYGREITARPETGVHSKGEPRAGARGRRISGHASGLRCALTSAGTVQSCRTRASRRARAPDARPRGAVLSAALFVAVVFSDEREYCECAGSSQRYCAIGRQLRWAATASALWGLTRPASCTVPSTLLSARFCQLPSAGSCALSVGGGLWIAATGVPLVLLVFGCPSMLLWR